MIKDTHVIVKSRNSILHINHNDILFMEQELRKVKLHTIHESHSFYGRLSDIKKQLDNNFCHCHRSYIINMDKILMLKDQMIYFINMEYIRFGREKFRLLKKSFDEYLQK